MVTKEFILQAAVYTLLFFMAVLLLLRLTWILRAAFGGSLEGWENTAASSGSQKLLEGWLVYVFDSRRPATRETNKVAEVLATGSTETQLEKVRLYKLDAGHSLPLAWIDLADETVAATGVGDFFKLGMGVYINGGGSTGLYLNNDFGADRVETTADAEKLLRLLFHAPSQRDLIDRVADEFGLYLEERDDVAAMEAALWKLYSN